MSILQGRNARFDLPMSNAGRKELGIWPEVVRNSNKHTALPIHDLHVGQHVMFQDSTSKIGTQQLLRVCVLSQEVTR